MSRRTITAAAVAVVLLVGAVGVVALTDVGGGEHPVAGTTPAPTLTFARLDGGITRLQDWQGRPMVVNFWASWCPPCVAEMRDAVGPLHRELGDQVVFLGINVEDDPGAALSVIARTGVTYPMGLDPVGEVFAEFRSFAMPTTVFLDAQSRVVATRAGEVTIDELAALVEQHLGVTS